MIFVHKDADALLPALADFVVSKSKEAIGNHGRFSFVLSGGSSPKKLFELLASDAYREKIDWKQTFFFFGDERNVPADHADSNYLMAKKALFDPLKISDNHIFRMKTELGPEEAATAYEKELNSWFAGKPVAFDLVLLGLGDNSHTASLFPHTSVLHEKNALVKSEYIDEVKMFRITLTAPCINQAKAVAFLVYGAGKALAVRHIIEDDLNIEEYPAQLIAPEEGGLYWFLDEGAAAELKEIR